MTEPLQANTSNYPKARQNQAPRGAKKDVAESNPEATSADESSFEGYATTVSTEKARRASMTDMVPIADERRPENGTLSGERPH